MAETRDTLVTYLEMKAPPPALALTPPRHDLSIVRAERPTVSFYRYLYNTVGEPWLWFDRKKLDDAALAAIVQDPAVEIWVLWAGGVPAGYIELDRRAAPEIELAYFGLIPDFLGKGLGTYLLAWGIEKAWSYRPRRFWVHTQTLDHPSALPLYERLGFKAYKTEVLTVQTTL